MRGGPGPFTPVDLAVACGRPLLLRQGFARTRLDQVILGCVNPLADEVNPARIAALRLDLGEAMPAHTVQRNCGSGMEAIDEGFRLIEAGRGDLILAGGTEALSHTPLLYSRAAVDWFAGLSGAKTLAARLRVLARLRPALFKPVIGLERGLTDPVVELNMGQTAELVAYLLDISREDADHYAVLSHQRLARAQKEGWLPELEPVIARNGTLYDHDDGVRPDAAVEKLAKLRAVFEPPYGKVTAGNSSQISDGAAWVILASEAAVVEHHLTPLARLVDSHWAALDPRLMGLGPTLAATPLLQRNGLARDDIGLWEINEAFATQLIGCLKAWQDDTFCRDVLGLAGAFGTIDPSRLNIDGGAISLGHPVGSSGARIILHLAHAMRRISAKRGIAALCIGGGQGGAVLVEAV